jgi:hypothetical protein
VQPQDTFVTILGLAGVPVPEGIESQDVLSIARAVRESPRTLAVAGESAGRWQRDAERVLFTVIDREWCLEIAAKPEHCLLARLDCLEDVAAQHPAVVEALYTAGIEELERRGTDRMLMSWLPSQGERELPTGCRLWDFYPSNAGWRTYYSRIYLGA